MDVDRYLLADVVAGANDLETTAKPSARAHRRAAKRQYQRVAQQESLADVCPEPPAVGESVHIVSDSKWDFWTWVPVMFRWLRAPAVLYCSTWTLNRQNAVELFELIDDGALDHAAFLTGTYFKRRETAVYAFLLDGLRRRHGRYRAFANHAKVLLLSDGKTCLTVEGSANLTSNPRLEQSVLTNCPELHAFHRAWMEDIFAAPGAVDKPQRNQPSRGSFRHMKAGAGVTCCTNHRGELRRILGAKAGPLLHEATIAAAAAAIVDAIHQALPILPPHTAVAWPTQGQTWPGAYAAAAIAARVALALNLEPAPLFGRTLRQPPLPNLSGATILLIDDAIQTGRTMRTHLALLRNAGADAYGFAYYGG